MVKIPHTPALFHGFPPNFPSRPRAHVVTTRQDLCLRPPIAAEYKMSLSARAFAQFPQLWPGAKCHSQTGDLYRPGGTGSSNKVFTVYVL